MKKISLKKLGDQAVGTFTAIAGLNVPLYASHACYFLVLAVFPALVLVLALLRYTGLEVETLVELLDGVLPGALMPSVKKLILSTYAGSSTAMVSVAALMALWSASRGMFGVVSGLNGVYRVAENRGYWYTRFISVVYTFLFLILLVLTLVLHVFGTTILNLISPKEGSALAILTEILDLRFFFLLFFQTGLFTAMYMALPNKRNGLRESLPGALLASIGWLVFSDLFSLYVEHFPSYSNIFGAVYTVALSMLWLYFCVSIVFYGGALNRWLMAANERKKVEKSGP